jgi:hypothetical protein
VSGISRDGSGCTGNEIVSPRPQARVLKTAAAILDSRPVISFFCNQLNFHEGDQRMTRSVDITKNKVPAIKVRIKSRRYCSEGTRNKRSMNIKEENETVKSI